jgi:hypothetical protein
VHIHSRKLWEKYLDVLPTTNKGVQYGTPEMAIEIMRVIKIEETQIKKVIVMGGHFEGIISFGKTVEEAVLTMLALQDE